MIKGLVIVLIILGLIFLFYNNKFSGYIDFDLSQINIRIFDICYFHQRYIHNILNYIIEY